MKHTWHRRYPHPRERVWRALTDTALVAQWLGAGAVVIEADEPRRVVYRIGSELAVVTIDSEAAATRVCVQMDGGAGAELLPKIERMIIDPAGHVWVGTMERSEYGD
ncbi:MAG TPA: hypothetical protein VJ276_19480, partial [Thermoanaerobaculia bacterium]|nr:hypothetical protein [Thermoanaerobaculia bacterium]